MTRQWSAEQIAAVAVHIKPEYPDTSAREAAELLDACAAESERRAKVAEQERKDRQEFEIEAMSSPEFRLFRLSHPDDAATDEAFRKWREDRKAAKP